MVQGFHGLRHDPVISGNHENDNIRDIGPACPHGAEGSMSRCVQEGNLLNVLWTLRVGEVYGVGSDVLGDPTRFAVDHIGFPNNIQQSGLPMVDVSHDGNDRGARIQVFVFVAMIELDGLLCLGEPSALLPFFNLETKSMFGADLLGDRFFNGLVDGRKDIQFHQVSNQLERLALNQLCQISDDDGWLEGNLFTILGDLVFLDEFGLRLGLGWSRSRLSTFGERSVLFPLLQLALLLPLFSAVSRAAGSPGWFGRELNETNFSS